MFETVILISRPALTLYEFNTLFALVSHEKQQKIMQFKFMRDAQNCLLGDILTRVEICRITGLGNKQLEFSSNSYGKPFLVSNPYINFNISHSGCYIACVLSDQPVGVDIEVIKPIDFKIAEKYFAPDETAYMMENNPTFRFYEIWTKKESRIKWEGKGLYQPLNTFSVIGPHKQGQIYYHKKFENDDAVSHVCSSNPRAPAVKIIDTESLLKNMSL